MLCIIGSPIAFSMNALFMKKNGIPSSAATTNAGIAGSFKATATITNSGGRSVSGLTMDASLMNQRIMSIVLRSASLLEANIKPMIAYAINAMIKDVPVV